MSLAIAVTLKSGIDMSSSTQPAGEPLALDSANQLRDDIAEHFRPATAYERSLVSNYALASVRYREALLHEHRAFHTEDPIIVLLKHPEAFKALTRYVADCERACRRALEELRRAIRERAKSAPSQTAAKPAARPSAPPAELAMAASASPAVSQAATAPRRE